MFLTLKCANESAEVVAARYGGVCYAMCMVGYRPNTPFNMNMVWDRQNQKGGR